MTELLLLSIKLSISSLILAIGMAATVTDIAYIWQRPMLLIRSLAAMYVFVPLAAFLIVKMIPLTQGAKVALLVLAVSSGAPILPLKLGRIGRDPYIYSLLVTSSLLAILIVPALTTLLSWHFGITTKFSMFDAAALIGKTILLPLLIGMALGALILKRKGQIADGLTTVAVGIFIVAIVALIALHRHLFMEVRVSGIVALLILMLIATAIGHILGGPCSEHRAALAMACCTRHVGVVAILAATIPGAHTLVYLVVYIVCSSIISLSYLHWGHRNMRAPAQVASN
jgi:BASS family bile acid:Na+ symporter